jgi:hypothetical protein
MMAMAVMVLTVPMAMMMPMVLLVSAADRAEMLGNGGFIEFVCLPLDNLDGVLGALAQTGAEAVAEVVRCQHRLAVYHLDGTLGT